MRHCKYWADENGHYFIRFEIKLFLYPAWTFIFTKIAVLQLGNSATVETHEVMTAGNVDVAQPQCVEGANATDGHVTER